MSIPSGGISFRENNQLLSLMDRNVFPMMDLRELSKIQGWDKLELLFLKQYTNQNPGKKPEQNVCVFFC